MRRMIAAAVLTAVFTNCYATTKDSLVAREHNERGISKQNRVAEGPIKRKISKENRLAGAHDKRGISKQNRAAPSKDKRGISKQNRVAKKKKKKIHKQNRVAEGQDKHTISKQNRVASQLKSHLEQSYPELKVDTIEKSPVPGIYELTSGPSVWYVSADGRYVLTGDVWDIEQANKKDQNLTEGVRRKLRMGLVDGLHNQKMIIYEPKVEKIGTVTVLTDPDCGYCKRLHSEIPKLSELGIELRYVAFPRQGMSSPTYTKMVGVWCSDDQKLAMTKAMSGEVIEADACEHPLEEQLILGEQLGISATPAMVFEDGTLLLGYMPPEKLAEKVKMHHLSE